MKKHSTGVQEVFSNHKGHKSKRTVLMEIAGDLQVVEDGGAGREKVMGVGYERLGRMTL